MEVFQCPFMKRVGVLIKETFNRFGSALEYLVKYTHKIAISNSRILSVDVQNVMFTVRGKRPSEPRRTITLTNTTNSSSVIPCMYFLPVSKGSGTMDF